MAPEPYISNIGNIETLIFEVVSAMLTNIEIRILVRRISNLKASNFMLHQHALAISLPIRALFL